MTNQLTLQDSRLAFIGAGAMATAIIGGLLQNDLVAPENITASDPYLSQLQTLIDQYPINTTQNNREAIQDKEIIVLAIKPQNLAKVGQELHGQLPTDALLLSILAGTPIAKLSHHLGHQRLVRVMPNTPALIGQGMSVWTNTDTVTEQQLQQATLILEALGEAIQVDNEDYLDMATALSGGGPAYVALFLEALIDASVHLGFSRAVATQLVYQTVEGSIALARHSQKHPAELRNMVTSPGGTTAEAIYQLDKGGFRTAISKALWAAYQKSRYLGSSDHNG